MKARKQSSTSYPILFLMVDSTDHVTGKTGLSPTVTISKNGGAFASPSGAITELSSGWYAIAGNATDRNTIGEFLIHATGTGADPFDDRYLVVAFDPFDANALGLAYLTGDAYARLGAAGAGLTAIGDARLAYLDALVSSRLAAASYSAPPTAAENADATLDELLSGHAIAGSAGAALSAAGAAGDPLLNPVPGSYASGTAGYILGNLPDRSINVVSPILSGQDLEFNHGFDYLAADGRSEDVTVSTWPTLTGATVVLKFGGLTWSVVSVTAATTIRIAIPRARWADISLSEGSYQQPYVIQATLTNTDVVDLMTGTLRVTKV